MLDYIYPCPDTAIHDTGEEEAGARDDLIDTVLAMENPCRPNQPQYP